MPFSAVSVQNVPKKPPSWVGDPPQRNSTIRRSSGAPKNANSRFWSKKRQKHRGGAVLLPRFSTKIWSLRFSTKIWRFKPQKLRVPMPNRRVECVPLTKMTCTFPADLRKRPVRSRRRRGASREKQHRSVQKSAAATGACGQYFGRMCDDVTKTPGRSTGYSACASAALDISTAVSRSSAED